MNFSLLPAIAIGFFAVSLVGCGLDSRTAATTSPAARAQTKEYISPSRGILREAEPQTMPAPDPAPPLSQTIPYPENDPRHSTETRIKERLIHHRFVLKTADGVSIANKARIPALEFNEGFHVAGNVCNRFTGQAELEGDLFTVKRMASTKMLCMDQALNDLEIMIVGMLEKGVVLTVSEKFLFLKGNGHVLAYEVSDWMR